jgi:hypothetical protein
VIGAGLVGLGLKHTLEASTADSGSSVEEEMRKGGVSGGIVDLDWSAELAGEAEYVPETVEEFLAANVVNKDDFQDLHVDNTFHMVLTQLLLAFDGRKESTKALVLGSSALARTSCHALELLSIPFINWDHLNPSSINLSTLDYSDISIVISALPQDSQYPLLPDSAFTSSSLIIDNRLTAVDSPLIASANLAKSATVTGLEFHLESLILALHKLIAPIGLPPSPVPASSKAMAQEMFVQFGWKPEQSPPPIFAKYISQ